MSEFTTPNPTANTIFSPAQWGETLRALPRELQNFFWDMFYSHLTAGSPQGVVGGFQADEGATLRTDIQAGSAFYYLVGDGIHSDFQLIYSEAELQGTHAARDGTFPRLDRVGLQWTTDTEDEETVAKYGSTTAPEDIKRGSVPVLVITAGAITDGTPDPPANPANTLPLWIVRVPTAGALVYYDVRQFLPGPKFRDITHALEFYGKTDVTAVEELISVYQRAVSGGITAFASHLKYVPLQDWFAFRRGNAANANDETTQDLYPMVVPGGRTWKKTYPLFLHTKGWSAGDDGSEFTVGLDNADVEIPATVVARAATAQDENAYIYVPLPVDSRGLEVIGVTLLYETTVAWTGASSTIDVVVYKTLTDGTAAFLWELDSTTELLALTADPTEVAFDVSDSVFVSEGDSVFFRADFHATAGQGGVGTTRLISLTLEFQEGRKA